MAPTEAPQPAVASITKATPVSLGLVVTVVCAIAGGVVWLNDALSGFSHQIDLMHTELRHLRSESEKSNRDRWTRAEMRAWVELANAKNDGMKLPEIK